MQSNGTFLPVANQHVIGAGPSVGIADMPSLVETPAGLAALAQMLVDRDEIGYAMVVNKGGTYVGTTVLTAASANFTAGLTTKTICLRGVAGGGGGGGIGTVVDGGGGGGGGAGGGYIEKNAAVVPGGVYAYTCGAAGAAGAAAGGTGGTGGNSTFIIAKSTYTALGGKGGVGATAVDGLSANLGGATGGTSTGGDLNGAGDNGGPGIQLSNAIGVSGSGGGSALGGAGGAGRATQGAGNAGQGYGAGGGGACVVSGGAQVAGGAGTGGCWIVDEYT